MPVQAVAQGEKYVSNALQGGFIENLGQWTDEVLFMANTKSLRAWITTKGMVFEQFENTKSENKEIKAHAVMLEYINPSKIDISKANEGTTKYNFILGKDKSKHVTNAKIYKDAKLLNVFDNIDMKLYFEENELRYDFIVHPQADPDKIQFNILGSEGYEIKNNELHIKTSLETIIQKELFAYQKNQSVQTSYFKNSVTASFQIDENILKFNVGEYDKSKELVIDPLVLLNSLIITNNGNPEYLSDIEIDSNGDLFFCGVTWSSTFPALGQFAGIVDGLIGKIHNDLSQPYWITFFGGEMYDRPTAIEVDDNNIYITGYTYSDENSFPLENAEYGIFHSIEGLFDNTFFTVFDKLQHNVVYSTYLRTASQYNVASDLKVSSSGKVYLTGVIDKVHSPAFTEFKQCTTQTQHVPDISTEYGYIIGFEPITTAPLSYGVMFRSYFCGDMATSINAIDIDDDDYIYITGNTSSSDLSFDITQGAFRTTSPLNARMVYICKLEFNQNLEILYNTYIGEIQLGQGNYGGRCIFVQNDTIYIGGDFDMDELPLRNEFDNSYNDMGEAFVSVIVPNGNGDDDLLYSSYFGGELRSQIQKLDYDPECNSLIFLGITGTPLNNYAGATIFNEFTGPWDLMIGTININLNKENTLTQLGYLPDVQGYVLKQNSIKFNSNSRQLYVGQTKDIQNDYTDIAFHSFDIPSCIIPSYCECSSFSQVEMEDWVNFTSISPEPPPVPILIYDPFQDTKGCLIKVNLDINNSCFTHIKMIVYREGFDVYETEIIAIDELNRQESHYFLPYGETSEVDIWFYRYPGDESPCHLTHTYQCPCKCSLVADEYITMEFEKGAPCSENDCHIEVGFPINDRYLNNCFTHVKYSSNIDNDETVVTEHTVELSNFNPSVLNRCISTGERYFVKLELMKSEQDENPCIIENSLYCPVIKDYIICDDECPEEWKEYDETIPYYESVGCEDCLMNVKFIAREACNGTYQDIQILAIETEIPDDTAPSCCHQLTREQLFSNAVRGIIKTNQMGFKPRSENGVTLSGAPCADNIRVSISSCWTDWVIKKCLGLAPPPVSMSDEYESDYDILTNPFGDPIHVEQPYVPGPCFPCPGPCKKIVVHKPCDSTCCRIRFRVCRYNEFPFLIQEITEIGEMENVGECENISYELAPNNHINCEFACHWLESVVFDLEPEAPNQAFDTDLFNDIDVYGQTTTKQIDDECYVIHNNTSLRVKLNSNDESNINISIYNIYGVLVNELASNISKGQNNYLLDISAYSSGVYIYVISRSGKSRESGKFMILK